MLPWLFRLPSIADNENLCANMKPKPQYDYIIVGAGSAGCVLAARLTENPETRVLLIEAGGADWDPLIRIPLAWGKMLLERKHDWGYFAEPEPNVDGRAIECARGKVLGGSSSTNAMAYVRGNVGDFNRWSRGGLPDWDYNSVLPYFIKAETWEGGANKFRGGEGPIHTENFGYKDDISVAYKMSALSAGYDNNPDYNGLTQDGFGPTQKTLKNGKRHSTSQAYLRSVRHRRNLTIKLHTMALRLNLEKDRAVSLEVAKDGKLTTVYASREIILCGGVINSPQLLMLSGIGPADHLKEHNITVVRDLAGVGQNLQDHISAWVNYERISDSPFVQQMRFDRLAINMVRAYLFGTGPATDFPQGDMGFIRLDPANEVPDIQLLFAAGPMMAHPWFPLIKKCFQNTFSCRAVVLHPKSRGHLSLASDDPYQAIRIHQNFFSAPQDMEILLEGLEIVRNIMNQPALNPHRGKELTPGLGISSREGLQTYVRQSCVTVHHPLGTCRMGIDDNAVVDGKLKVHGIDGLRIADASIMPDMTSGNINAPVIMIAEKAADIIRGTAS